MSDPATLTAAEAAFVADIPDRDVWRVFEEGILKEPLVRRAGAPRVSYLGAACASFYFKTEKIYAAAFRRYAVDALTSRVLVSSISVHALEDICSFKTKVPGEWRVNLSGPVGDLVPVDFSVYVTCVKKRLTAIERARELISTDPEVLGGTPVFKNTRIPVDIIAASLKKGTDPKKLMEAYPDLGAEHLEAAAVYAVVQPPMGRPRKSLPSSWKVRKSTRNPGRSTGA